MLNNLTVEVVHTITLFGLSDISVVTLDGELRLMASVESNEAGETINSVKVCLS